MKNIVLFPFFVLFFTCHVKAQLLTNESLNIGEKLIIFSEILNEDREINVYLPESYDPKSMTYPIIYLLDGSMSEDFLHVVGVTQFQSYPWINEMPEAIVVGIENIDRKRDFTFPTTIEKDKIDFPTTGGSDKFIQFIEIELQQIVERKYSTSGERILIGQSLGGLLATEILYKKPELFTHYLIVSPSLWWNEESLLDLELNLPETTQVHIAVGKEGKVMVRDAKRLRKRVKNEGLQKGLTFSYYKSMDHANILHIAVFEGLPKFTFYKNR